MFSVSRKRLGRKLIQHCLLFQIATLPVEAVPNAPRWWFSTRVGDTLLTRQPNATHVEHSEPVIRGESSRPIWNTVRSVDTDEVDFDSKEQSSERDGSSFSAGKQSKTADGTPDHTLAEGDLMREQDRSILETFSSQQPRQPHEGPIEVDKNAIPTSISRGLVEKDARRLLSRRELRKLLDLSRPSTKSSPSRKRAVQVSGPAISDESALSFYTEVLRMLWKMPIEKQIESDQAKLYLSRDAIIALTGRLHQNIWTHPVRDGCQVHVHDHNSEVKGKRLVGLRGSPRAIELTRGYLLRAERSLHPETTSSLTMSPLIVSSGLSNARLLPSEINVVAIEEPDVWNVKSFLQYIERLVDGNTTTHLDRLIAQSGRFKDLPGLPRPSDPRSKEGPQFQAIAARLDQLFTDPKLHHCISSAAQDLAIQFLLKYYQLRPGESLRTIWSIMVRDRDTLTRLWNKLFGTALRSQSVGYIRSLFDYAREMDIPVFTDTGLEIFRQTKSLKVKIGVSQWLAENKLLKNPSMVRRFTEAIMPDMIKSHFTAGESARSFFEKMDQGVGPIWLRDQCISAMFSIFAKNKLRQPAEESILLLLERGINPSTSVLSQMTYLYYRRGTDINQIIDLWSSDWARRAGRVDRFVIPYAFMSAWKSFRYNTARVLWHYAALKGVLTYQMRQLVYWSLVRNRFHEKSAWRPTNPVKREWKLSAAKVIAGVTLDTQDLARKYSELVQDYLNSTITTTTGTTSSSPATPPAMITSNIATPFHWLLHAHSSHRDPQKSLVRDILRSDEWAVVHHTLPLTFKLTALLRAAIEMDQKWHRDDVLHDPGKGLDWMVSHAIQVPVVRRETPLHVGLGLETGVDSGGSGAVVDGDGEVVDADNDDGGGGGSGHGNSVIEEPRKPRGDGQYLPILRQLGMVTYE